MSYSRSDGLTRSVKRNALCKSCAITTKPTRRIGYKHSVETKRKIKEKRKYQVFDDNFRSKVRAITIKRKTGLSVEEYESIKPAWELYYRKVWSVTKKQPLVTLDNFELRGVRSYHVDHKIPIMYGFRNNISPEEIGHISNLQMLWYTDNIRKGARYTPDMENII